MNLLKKFSRFSMLIVGVLTVISAASCKKNNSLYDSVSVLRSDIYEGLYNGVTVTAELIYGEYPEIRDGIVGDKETRLIFTVPITEPDRSYSVTMDYGGRLYSENFVYDGVKNVLTATLFPEGFDKKSFSAKIALSSSVTEVKFDSVIKGDFLSHKKILDSLNVSQKTYLSSFISDGKFSGEIIMKIAFMSGRIFWYVAVCNQDGGKAMLLDGATADLVAIRDVL